MTIEELLEELTKLPGRATVTIDAGSYAWNPIIVQYNAENNTVTIVAAYAS